jgi:hypothetical protein
MKKLATAFLLILSVFLLSMTLRRSGVDDELLRISNEYTSYSLYNTQNYWTIALCEPHIDMGSRGDTLHISLAEPKKSPHGDKLYKLYVKDEMAYTNQLEKQPVGQVIIKEVWNVRPVLDVDSATQDLVPAMRSMNDGRFYTPTTRKTLFIMYKTQPSEENDEGWWYGIVDIEKGVEHAQVLESKKINRCIQCHQQNKIDRIFGSPN